MLSIPGPKEKKPYAASWQIGSRFIHESGDFRPAYHHGGGTFTNLKPSIPFTDGKRADGGAY
ncbi:hypothetical protein N875_10845 [Neisseria meningitidis LNP21362]|nr:hypothetical protein N875_10845 [Neisseria meningitidis LNP21362]